MALGRNTKSAMGNRYIQVFTTVPKRSDAELIARILMEKKLSACTQIFGPVTSIYKWKGQTKKSKEWMCILKTRKDKYKMLERVVKEIHPYELPEIIAVPIITGSQDYFDWMKGEL